MYCRYCGNAMDPSAVVCTRCGVPVGTGNNYCPNCGVQTNPQAVMCPNCGVMFGPVNDPLAKSKLVAGLLGIFLGGFGIHNFYLGYTGKAVAQIIVTLVTCGVGSLWGLIEGVLILCGTSITTDASGRPLSNN